MTAEEKNFGFKRFIPEKLTVFGFLKTPQGFVYERDIMNGDFRAMITVSDDGKFTGKLIDNMNNEEFRRFNTEAPAGAYVSSVRSAYEQLLYEIADNCCGTVLFFSDQANRITEKIYQKYGIKPDFQWDEAAYRTAGTFRHADSGKWFALIMNINRHSLMKNNDSSRTDVINLKRDTGNDSIITDSSGIFPAYHMNHKHWISVLLDDTLPDDEIMKLIEISFALTQKKQNKKKQQ